MSPGATGSRAAGAVVGAVSISAPEDEQRTRSAARSRGDVLARRVAPARSPSWRQLDRRLVAADDAHAQRRVAGAPVQARLRGWPARPRTVR